MRLARWLVLLVMLWLSPLRSAQADIQSVLEWGSRCQPGSLLALTHGGGGVVLPVWRSPVQTAPLATQYSLELGTALGCALHGMNRAGPVIFPELGYSLTMAPVEGDSDTLTHLAKIGVSAGYGSAWATVSYGARLLLGARGPDVAVGVRHGVTGRFVYNILSVEIAHQLLAVGGGLEQDLRFTASVNLFLFLLAVGYMR